MVMIKIFCFLLHAEFPLQFQQGTGQSNFTVHWEEYSICIPRERHKHRDIKFRVVLVPVIAENSQEEWKKKKQVVTADYNYHFDMLDSTYAYKIIVSLQSDKSEFCIYKCIYNLTQVSAVDAVGDIIASGNSNWIKFKIYFLWTVEHTSSHFLIILYQVNAMFLPIKGFAIKRLYWCARMIISKENISTMNSACLTIFLTWVEEFGHMTR